MTPRTESSHGTCATSEAAHPPDRPLIRAE
jgi:hypothetical protein